MRFKASIHNISTFTRFAGALASIGPVAWVRLDDHEVRFTIIPEQGSQVWAVLQIDTIFETYTVQSAAESNTINLEVPVGQLHKALRSALQATSASIRLTKKNNIPLLSLTITTTALSSGPGLPSTFGHDGMPHGDFHADDRERSMSISHDEARDRETLITQSIPIRVLSEHSIEGLHEPRCREPDVHILLPPLMQLKSISDRFTKLALATTTKSATTAGRPAVGLSGALGPRLEMAANAHGCLKLSIRTDAMNISSLWTGLRNPELDPVVTEGGEEGVEAHPSTRMKELGDAEGRSEEGWARVRIDGRDWSKVLSVGRLGGRVVACFCDEHALILYVYLPNDEDGPESVLTYYISSYST